MDDLISTTGLYIAVGLLVLIRFLNNLIKAAYFALGRISIIALAERAKETNAKLRHYLADPVHLGVTAQAFDKLALFALIIIALQAVPQPEVQHFALFLGYLLLFDLLFPNAIAAFSPEGTITFIFPFMHLPYLLISPISSAISKMVRKGRERELEEDHDEEQDPQDIRAFIQAGTEEGIIEAKEGRLMSNLLSFSDTIVREVMTPRTDMVCVEIDTQKNKILEVFKQSKHSRIPVFRDNIDHIEGILRVKDMIELLDTDKTIADVVKQPLFVPEGRNINELLQDMLTGRLQMAIVIDEYGGTSGLITLENLVEEIVGEIHEEHEAGAEKIIELNDGTYMVDGKLLLEDFCETFGVEVAEENVDTVGGFLFNQAGSIPAEGTAASVGSIAVEIAKADERRIYKIIVKANSVTETAGAELA